MEKTGKENAILNLRGLNLAIFYLILRLYILSQVTTGIYYTVYRAYDQLVICFIKFFIAFSAI